MIDRSTARRFGRAAQAAGGALAIGAIALAALGVGRGPVLPPPEEPTITPSPAAGSPAGQPGPQAIPVDIEGIAYRLGGPEAPPIAQTPDVPVDQADVPPPIVHSRPDVKFLGLMTDPLGPIALVRVDGKQRLLRTNRSFNGVTVLAMNENQITISDPLGERTVDRSARTGSALSQRAAAAAGQRGTGDPQFGSGMNGAMNGGMNGADGRNTARPIDPMQSSPEYRQRLRREQMERDERLRRMQDQEREFGTPFPDSASEPVFDPPTVQSEPSR